LLLDPNRATRYFLHRHRMWEEASIQLAALRRGRCCVARVLRSSSITTKAVSDPLRRGTRISGCGLEQPRQSGSRKPKFEFRGGVSVSLRLCRVEKWIAPPRPMSLLPPGHPAQRHPRGTSFVQHTARPAEIVRAERGAMIRCPGARTGADHVQTSV